MPFELFIHQEALDVRPVGEPDAEHVPDLALEPVGARPQVAGRHRTGVAAQPGGERYAAADEAGRRVEAHEAVDELEALVRPLEELGLLGVRGEIEGREVDEKIETVVVLESLERGPKSVRLHPNHGVEPRALERDDRPAERCLDRVEERLRFDHWPRPPCSWIFFCSIISPWITVSGRGGQPGIYRSTGRIVSMPCTVA